MKVCDYDVGRQVDREGPMWQWNFWETVVPEIVKCRFRGCKVLTCKHRE